jgi:hypothetical protein
VDIVKDTVHNKPVAIGQHKFVLVLMTAVVELEIECTGVSSMGASEHMVEVMV